MLVSSGADDISTHSENAQEHEEEELVRVPVLVVRNLEEDSLTGTERIEELERCSRDHSAEETPPHNLGREEVRNLLEREERPTDWRTECHSDSCSASGTQNLPPFRLVRFVFREESADDVPDTARDVHKGPFLAK
jgi:hypothetical protein